MNHRPLIPVLFSFVGGILLGHAAFPLIQSFTLLVFLLIASSLIVSLFISDRPRFFCTLFVFFLVGVLLDQNAHHPPALSELSEKRQTVTIEGTVLQPPRVSRDMARFEVRAEKVFVKGDVQEIGEKVLVTVYDGARGFSPGDRIRFPARLGSFRNFNNPGRYNYELAMSLKGLSCAASVSDSRHIVVMGKGFLGFPLEMVERIRGPIRNLFREKLSPQNHALYSALILGERQGIGPELREPFNIAGLGHMLAVSGLHIGLVGWLVFSVTRGLLSLSYRLTLKMDIRKVAALMTGLPLIAYAFLAGFEVSSQRAMVMGLAFLWSMILGREKDVWSTLTLAAFIVLALDPHAPFSISFQLSFCAVIGIVWLAPLIYEKLPGFGNGDFRQKRIWGRVYFYFAGLLAITLSATVFLLPITCFYFHRISIVAMPANLTVLPVLGFWVLPLGFLAAIFLPVSSSLAGIFLAPGAWGLDLMTGMIRFWATLPFAAFWTITPNGIEMVLFYGLIFFTFFARRYSWARAGALCVLSVVLIDVAYWTYQTRFNPELRVTYLDVGQGNAALIQFPGKERMLIDGGGFSRDHFDVGKMVVAPFLFRSKIRRIDTIVLTHPQADHMNGLRFVAANFDPKEFWYNGDRVESESFTELMRILETEDITKMLPYDLRGGREISGVKIELLHPPGNRAMVRRQDHQTMELNNNSVVLKLSHEGKSLLFPGDLERMGEEALVSSAGSLLDSDILLAPHHGSKGSCSEPFLRMVRPRLCIVSCGSGNFFGFPHEQTLRRLEAVGCKTLRTDQVGAVRLSIGRNRFEVGTFLGSLRRGFP